MSSVKNDPATALGNLWNSVVKEGARAAGEARKLVAESIDDIGKATTSGGVVGGALQAFEELSPGNFAAGALDVLTGRGELDPKLAAGIRGGVNLLVGAMVPGPGLLLQAQALKDAAGAFGMLGAAPASPTSPPAAQHPGATQQQSTARPSEAAGPTTNRVHETRLHGGYGPPVEIADGMISIASRMPKLGKNEDTRLAKLEKDLAKADADIDKILSNPNLSFEDMIFMLMSAVIKQSQAEVKIGLADEKAARDVAKGGRDLERNAIKTEGSAIAKEQTRIAGMEAGTDKDTASAALNERKTKLDSRSESLTTSLGDASESRTERFEELKNAMNKLSEMQQSLSNILNTMHQSAMNTIGNIR
jgi:hypothetical protein